VDIDTVRYSVPHALVGEHVEVQVRDATVEVFAGAKRVAAHARSSEPGAIVRDPAHFVGIWRTPAEIPAAEPPPGQLAAMGRSLSDYTAVIEEAA
jgi:hypothetical protein